MTINLTPSGRVGDPPQPIRIDTEYGTLSGISAEPAGSSNGLLVALHGGGSGAAYFDSPVCPESSLLALAAATGWRAVSLDRPGYGASTSLQTRRLDLAAQAGLLRDVVARLAAGAPMLLVGHSLGAITALQLARQIEREPGDIRLLGVAVGGAPLVYTAEQRALHATVDASGMTIRRPPGALRDPGDWLGPEGSYPPQLREQLHEVVSRVPSGEMADAANAPELLAELLSEAHVPVQFAVAELESTMASAAAVFTRAAEILRRPGSELFMVPGSGHNLSLGFRARSYHLRVLSFAEQLLAGSTNERSVRKR
ncbi:alpha/beta fold hydrolase [Rhodococcus sp. NPDC127530]|uniref:alpha/beta fold hydrolase n=1 Tax=unclassified Rhodococcus (in: high G+C Gram-positive bacteria) TaxID=192944 RepID=UPI0036276E9B